MERRNTIQKQLVLNAVTELHSHITAEEAYAYVRRTHPAIGKATVYRNLQGLAEEGKIRRIQIPNGPDRFDFRLERHPHLRCVKCGRLFDVDMGAFPEADALLGAHQGMEFLDYDLIFTGVCQNCQKEE